jgi:Type I phosphodiesterase / nucleotide pyrophosphatase
MRTGLGTVPNTMLTELGRARRGVVVLAVDGLSYSAAVAGGWDRAELTGLDSTFPSTSTTGWLTALTGVGPDRHGVPGMIYRVPGRGMLLNAVTGRVLARGPADPGDRRLVVPQPTVFDRAGEAGVTCVAVPREIGWLTGRWAAALLHGALLVQGPDSAALTVEAADPARLAGAVAAQIARVLADLPPGEPALLWVYVNLDDHVHRHGYDDAVLAAVTRLGDDAERWCAQGWTVLGHSDHGQVRCVPDPELRLAWSRIDNPVNCYLPAGGAGRVRWLYVRPERRDAVRNRLATALGDAGEVLTADRLAALGLAGDTLRGRVGDLVVLATSERFPVPDETLRWEHGGTDEEERLVPLAIWRS